MPPGERAFRAAAVGIVALAAVLLFWALDLGLPHPLARPDEEVVLAQTAAPARGEILLDWSIYPSAYVGLTLAVKYPAVILLVPAYAAAAWGSPARGWRRLVPAPAVVVGAVAAAVFLATSPSLVLNPRSRDVLTMLLSTLVPRGVPGAISPPDHAWWGGFAYHASFSLRYGAGLAPALLAPVAIVWAAASRRRLLVLAAVFAVAYYGVVGISPVNQARYIDRK